LAGVSDYWDREWREIGIYFGFAKVERSWKIEAGNEAAGRRPADDDRTASGQQSKIATSRHQQMKYSKIARDMNIGESQRHRYF
jgi:hypothetical protein